MGKTRAGEMIQLHTENYCCSRGAWLQSQISNSPCIQPLVSPSVPLLCQTAPGAELLQLKCNQFCAAAPAAGCSSSRNSCVGAQMFALPPFSATGSCFSVTSLTESPICWGNFKGFGTTHQVFCTWHKNVSWGDFMMPMDRNIQTNLSGSQNFCTKQP